MAVQKGRLTPTDTNTDMGSDFYNDPPTVNSVSDVDRIIHNGTQFLRLAMQRPQAVAAARGEDTAPDSLTDSPHYIDKLYAASSSSGIEVIRIDFGLGNRVDTLSIVVWSTQLISDTPADWIVATSIDGTHNQFSEENLIAVTQSVTVSTENPDGNGDQFKHTVVVTTPPIGNGLRFWRLKHGVPGSFDNVTEVEIVPPLNAAITPFNSGGGAGLPGNTFGAGEDILDACWESINNSGLGQFYTIRFNDQTTGSTSITLDDDFSDGEAGTASGTNAFNSARWTENASNSLFIRLNEELSYNISSGDGQLETTFSLVNDSGSNNESGAEIFVVPTTVDAKDKWFAIRALDSSNNVIASEGVGYNTNPTTTGVWFSTRIDSFTDSSGNCDLREIRPLWHNTTLGTDVFTVTFSGSAWLVSGTETGALTDATTGVDYNEGVDASTPVSFIISCTANPSDGEQFTFDLITSQVTKPLTDSGTIGFTRVGSTLQTNKTIGSPVAGLSTDAVTVELYGNTAASINISADDFAVSGTEDFPDIPVFTVERREADGDVIGSPLISSFDVIGNPNASYNDFLDGRVQIAVTASGAINSQFVYIKVNNVLYKYSASSSLGTETGSNSLIGETPSGPITGQIAKDGTHSLQWTHRSGSGGVPFLSYIEYDSTLDVVRLRTLDKDTLQDTTETREVILDISNYDTNELKVFYNQLDFDTLYFVETDLDLNSFNLDDTVSAFLAVNAIDVTLAAGTETSTTVNADVINAWGETLDGKAVTWSVSAGDGAVSPSSSTTGTPSAGRAFTTFTVGSTVGVSTITASVTDT